jgi:hypothetical protein
VHAGEPWLSRPQKHGIFFRTPHYAPPPKLAALDLVLAS